MDFKIGQLRGPAFLESEEFACVEQITQDQTFEPTNLR